MRVMRMVVKDAFNGRQLNMISRLEIWLANSQVNHFWITAIFIVKDPNQ